MIKTATLSNGIRVVTDFMPHIETASLGVWVNVGARCESKALNGASHFLEHMAFKGTSTRSANQIASEIESLGGYLNAYTSRENTAYYVKMLKCDVEKGFEILCDILFNSVFEKSEFEKERTVILQELYQSLDTPDDIIFDYFHQAAFGDNSFGRPILGTQETINSFTPAMIQGYMMQNYDTHKMVISVSGNIDHDSIVSLCEKYFSVPSKSNASNYEKAGYVGGDFRKEKDLEQAHLLLGFEGFSYGTPEYYSSAVLSTILGAGMSSRLFQEVREKRGLVYSIFASTSAFKETGIFQIYASSGESTAKDVMPVICDVLCDVGQTLHADEIRKAKTQLKASLMMALESSSGRAESKAMHLINFERIVSISEIQDKIEAVNEDTIKHVLKSILKTPATFTALGPIDGIQSYDQIQGRFTS